MNHQSIYSDITNIKKGTKVLFANFPADGHFNPLTGLAVHLKKIGCDVRWYTSRNYQQKIEQLEIPFYRFNKAVDISGNMDIDEVFPERKAINGQLAKLKYDLVHAFILRSPEYYEDIQDVFHEFPFQVMIADVTFGAIPFVKEEMGIPVIAIGVVPLPETSRDLPPYGLGLTPSNSFIGKLRQSVLRFISNKIIFAGPTKLMQSILKQHGIDTDDANIFDILIRKSTLVLQSGTPGFEYQRSDKSKHIHFAGPLLPYKKPVMTSRWFDERLKEYKKVILITQGTVEKDVNKLLVPALEAFGRTDVLLIVTTGGIDTNTLRDKYPYNNVIIEDYIPFDDVMPYADIYISNGGYGGVLLGIQNSLPMIVAGVHEGKNEINARIGYFKIGINLKTEKPSPTDLKKAAATIFKDDVYRKNVKKLQAEFKAYHPNEICSWHIASVLSNNRTIISTRREQMEAIY